jgi:hypothetical protein
LMTSAANTGLVSLGIDERSSCTKFMRN